MSGIKDTAYSEFLRSLRPIGGASALAQCAMTNRAHLSQVLSGKRRGLHTWKRVLSFLTEGQVLHLQQSATWNSEIEAVWTEELARRKAAL